MKNEEKLYLAVGEIDEELIKEASEAYRPKIRSFYKGFTVAASVIIVSAVALVFGVLIGVPTSDGKGSCPGESPDLNVSPDGYLKDESTNDSSYGASLGRYLTGLELLDDFIVKFHLSVTENDSYPVDLSLCGSYFNELGEQKYAVCKTAPSHSRYEILLTPSYTVNGMPADSIPTKKGEYDITVDFSIINEYDFIWDDYILIDKEEYFKIISK